MQSRAHTVSVQVSVRVQYATDVRPSGGQQRSAARISDPGHSLGHCHFMRELTAQVGVSKFTELALLRTEVQLQPDHR